ncbi:MAG: epoxide hydrolase family protein [Jatrophihabitantaceae bacterium]
MPSTDAIEPFRIEIAESALIELRERLARARWADELPGADWDYGIALQYLKELHSYWLDGYDWRKHEAVLNSYPQFRTTIDGQQVHFLHVRSPRPDAVPLIISHGWPGSFADFLDLIEPLTNPDPATGAPAFDLVIPSLPGYAFSGPTTEPGWDPRRIGRAWAELMQRLGYHRYGVAGNDAGSLVSVALASEFGDRVLGMHVTQLWSGPIGEPGELDDLTAADQQALDVRNWFIDNLGAYNALHSQQPQTLAHALADSPIGLLAWYCQIFRDEVNADFILTNVMLTWLTGTVAANLRLYYEIRQAELRGERIEPTEVPVGLAQFGNDYISMRRFAERDHHNIVSWNGYEQPGHYAAHQSPDLLIADLRGFFAPLR